MADTEKSDPHAAHFRAFVSYSHADAAVAQKLHRKIETYRLPDHLRDRKASAPDDGRLGRIFRDREDLPAAADLSGSVKRALAGSQALIVICSPDARASIWVAREIELFRALHPDRPVLAALVRGEPEEAFPESLLEGAEPLAADLRKEGDGWRLGFLKIVAGVAEVPLDALVQRDATRRIRRVMAVTGGALVALLVMIGMTIFAIQSRIEAQHQQAQAEGLVEYMLTDLRTELRGVGRLDVMTKVNERAMDYYEDQGDLSDMPAESLERRARILHAMGEDEVNRNDGSLEKALSIFNEAHRVTEALLLRDPKHPDRIFGHAQSEFWVGSIFYAQNRKINTLDRWEKYRNLSLALEEIEPNMRRSIQELSYAEGNLCALALDKPIDPTEALEKCTIALKEMQKIQTREPDDPEILQNVANRFAWLADAWKANGNLDQALYQRRNQERLLERLLAAEPNNFQRKELLMKSHLAMAETSAEACDSQNALRYEELFRELVADLTQQDPDNKIWEKFASRKPILANSMKRSCNNGARTATP